MPRGTLLGLVMAALGVLLVMAGLAAMAAGLCCVLTDVRPGSLFSLGAWLNSLGAAGTGLSCALLDGEDT